MTTLLLLPLFLITVPSPVVAADDPDLDVRITGLSPSNLEGRSAVTMTGTVTNRNEHVWADAQAYLVIPTTPFTTRQQVDDAIDTGTAYTGERVIDLKSIDELGDLGPGRTARFEVRVPYGRLGISGAEGVYPVGVQILGTDVDGTRATAAIGRATTFLPLVPKEPDRVSAGVVWPFLMPDRRQPDGTYADPAAMLDLVSTGGRLRNQLDLAAAVRARASTVIIDPALLVGLDEVSRGRRLPEGLTVSEQQRTAARQFLTDLIALARQHAAWVVQYDRPDVLGITQSPTAGELSESIERATSSTLARFQVTGRRVTWPTDGGVTGPLLSAVRGSGETPVIVSPSAVPDWERRDGSLVQYAARSGPMPLLVNDALDAGVPGETTTVTLRQRILGEAALASLQRGADPSSRADAVVIIDPRWNPGPVAETSPLDDAFDAAFVDGISLEDLMTQPLAGYDGSVPRTAEVTPIGEQQIATAAEAAETFALIAMITPNGDEVEARHAREVADALGVRWRDSRTEGLAAARAAVRRAERDIDRVDDRGPDGGHPLQLERQLPGHRHERHEPPGPGRRPDRLEQPGAQRARLRPRRRRRRRAQDLDHRGRHGAAELGHAQRAHGHAGRTGLRRAGRLQRAVEPGRCGAVGRHRPGGGVRRRRPGPPLPPSPPAGRPRAAGRARGGSR